MTDLEAILPLWQALVASGTEYVLATVVNVEGSGYRKPGARMLVAADGRRAGTISGGCLEAEVARKAFWHTEQGPVVRRYSTVAGDGEVPFGMGCGGVVHLLLERGATAHLPMTRLAESFARRLPLAMATVTGGDGCGLRAFWPPAPKPHLDPHLDPHLTPNFDPHLAGDEQDRSPLGAAISRELTGLARMGFARQASFAGSIMVRDCESADVHVEWIAARPGLFVFGAGDDAIPLVRQARQLGWYVELADGRSHLATAARFPEAHRVRALSGACEWPLDLRPTDAAVVMTHSLEQDTGFLRALLRLEPGLGPSYIGVLGPRRRTMEIVESLAAECGGTKSAMERTHEKWMARMHAPMGLDLGGDTPAEIALSVIAEIQQNRNRATGMPLCTLAAPARERNLQRRVVPA